MGSYRTARAKAADMTTWTITRTDTDDLLADGEAPNVRLAWARVIPAVMDQLATDPAIPGYRITIDDDPPALVFPGRSESGHRDLAELRGCLHELAIAVLGEAVFAETS